MERRPRWSTGALGRRPGRDVPKENGRPTARSRGSLVCWPTSGSNRRWPRPSSCISPRRAGGLTSSASTTGWCPATRSAHDTSSSSRDGPHAKQCSTPDRIRQLTARSRTGRGRRTDRAGHQPIPAWLGGLVPLPKLRPRVSQDPHLCDRQARAAGGQAPQTAAHPRLEARGAPDRPHGADQPRRKRRCSQTQPGPAGADRAQPVNDVRQPCAGQPHARFEGRALDTARRSRATATIGQHRDERRTLKESTNRQCPSALPNLSVRRSP